MKEVFMGYQIKRAMVIGSGVMGGGIAGHLANAGISVYLVDIVPRQLTPQEEAKGLTLKSPAVRNRIVNQGMEFLKKSKPSGLFSSSRMELITAGNMEDNWDWIKEVDWIIEVVVENLAVKHQVMARIEETRKPGSIVSTNTSGLPIGEIAQGRSDEFKAHFLGTHFFNPARYLKLLEIIPTPQTNPELTRFMMQFGERRLGKTMVLCKDTPNFIANRIASITGTSSMNYVLQNDYTIEEVDAITGPLVGHPKTASFKLQDLVGLDVSSHVANNLYPAIPHDPFRDAIVGPVKELTGKMVEKGWLGKKTKQGFYKKTKTPEGKKANLVLDLKTMEYRPEQKPDLPLIKQAKAIESLPERFRFLVKQDDRMGRLIWNGTALALAYAASVVPEISDNLYSIDTAVKTGFFHEMGPFEIWDALGVKETADRMEADGFKVAPWVKEMLRAGGETFYKKEGVKKSYWDQNSKRYQPMPVDPHLLILADRKAEAGVLQSNPSASLIDLGDGVLCLEFHSKMNSLDTDIVAMGETALDYLDKNYTGLVIGNEASNFCVGANVFNVLVAADAKQWNELDKEMKRMQDLMMAFRYSSKPVVAAPIGMALGGGAEVCMAADRVCVAAETYLGQVEVGVGLVPGAGGCRELLKRVVSPVMKVSTEMDPLPLVLKVFQAIAMAKVSTSALEAREMGFLTDCDQILMKGEHRLAQAKQMVLDMAAAGYAPPPRTKNVYAIGSRGLAAMTIGLKGMLWSGYVSDYDLLVSKKIAYILSGGALSAPQWVDEQLILDLEREAFLSLLGQEKTIDRIKHMLTTGKPLRN
jgi:3-hydroxyacyl-CoA dehydrogenase